jgi:hypothetical protein
MPASQTQKKKAKEIDKADFQDVWLPTKAVRDGSQLVYKPAHDDGRPLDQDDVPCSPGTTRPRRIPRIQE